ncbi:hypothetical protein ABPG72_006786 [Tetrahymena utriculariae]
MHQRKREPTSKPFKYLINQKDNLRMNTLTVNKPVNQFANDKFQQFLSIYSLLKISLGIKQINKQFKKQCQEVKNNKQVNKQIDSGCIYIYFIKSQLFYFYIQKYQLIQGMFVKYLDKQDILYFNKLISFRINLNQLIDIYYLKVQYKIFIGFLYELQHKFQSNFKKTQNFSVIMLKMHAIQNRQHFNFDILSLLIFFLFYLLSTDQ